MSFLLLLVAFGGWFLLAGLACLVVAAVMGMNGDDEPFLCRVADKRDQKRRIDQADERLTLLTELEQTYALPAIEPWWRHLP